MAVNAIRRPIEFLLSKHCLVMKVTLHTRSFRITVHITPKDKKVQKRGVYESSLNILSHKLDLSEEEKQNYTEKLCATEQ